MENIVYPIQDSERDLAELIQSELAERERLNRLDMQDDKRVRDLFLYGDDDLLNDDDDRAICDDDDDDELIRWDNARRFADFMWGY